MSAGERDDGSSGDDRDGARRITDSQSGPQRSRSEASHSQPISVVPLKEIGTDVVPCLVVISGRQMGQVFPLVNRPDARIGRADDADLCIRDTSISLYHAAVYIDERSRCRVRDLGSTNGTFVNGKRIQDGELVAGDRIQLGKSTVLKLEYHGKMEHELHTQLYDAGTRDPLTGIFNRRYLDQHLDADFRLAMRHKEDMSLLLIDVDRFKTVNDTHGHLAGDAVLRALSNLLSSRARHEDILARYGGEEFVIILRCTNTEGATSLAESIRATVAGTAFAYKTTPIAVTVSIGVATLVHPNGYRSAAELLSTMDSALYDAKRAGRNRVAAAKGPK
ncbi:MAG: GGDEF domain-containing protein [Myxococcota bacterium]